MKQTPNRRCQFCGEDVTCEHGLCPLCQLCVDCKRDQDLAAPVPCTTTDRHGDECRTLTAQLCVDCGCGVCIPCNLPCFECALPLHDHCRDEHAKSSGHRVDGPAGMPRLSQRPLTGTLIDELLAIGGAL